MLERLSTTCRQILTAARATAAMLGYRLKRGEAPDSYDILPALTGEAKQPIRDHPIQACAKRRLALRKGRWVYIEAQGCQMPETKEHTK